MSHAHVSSVETEYEFHLFNQTGDINFPFTLPINRTLTTVLNWDQGYFTVFGELWREGWLQGAGGFSIECVCVCVRGCFRR